MMDENGGGVGPILRRYSIEITARDPDSFKAVRDLLPAGTEVFVADLPHQEPEVLVSTCAGLREAGLEPVPHLVARNVRSAEALETLLRQLADRAAVDRALVLGGDRDEPRGPFADALQLMERGALREHGIARIALACFPEGHPDIPDDALLDALRAKLLAADRLGFAVVLVSQFTFEADPVLDFLRRLRADGIGAPFRVGVAGPADRETLLRFGRELGAGDSVHALEDDAEARRRAGSDEIGPDALLEALAAAQAADPTLAIEGVHFFAFGSTAETIGWARDHRERSLP